MKVQRKKYVKFLTLLKEEDDEEDHTTKKTPLELEQEKNPRVVKPAPKMMKLTEEKHGKMLDLVFVIDCTGSMGSYIQNVQVPQSLFNNLTIRRTMWSELYKRFPGQKTWIFNWHW